MMERESGLPRFPTGRAIVLAAAILASACSGNQILSPPQGPSSSTTSQRETAISGILQSDTTLSGHVTLADDLFIPEGVTLTLRTGTVVTVQVSDGSRTDPQYLSTETEILVRGALLAEEGPVTISTAGGAPGSWAGIVMATPNARVLLTGAAVRGAEFGLLALDGSARLVGCSFEDCEVGVAAAPGAAVGLAGNRFVRCETGAMSLGGAEPLLDTLGTATGVAEPFLALPRHEGPGPGDLFRATEELRPVLPRESPVTREYLGELGLTEDTTWSGTVIVGGQVAVPEGVTLTVSPGTRVLFRFTDTDRDGLGESWIVVQGRLRVLGEDDAWVLFDAEDPAAAPGAWDSLSLIASSSEDNMVRYAVFRRGVKAFHDHFSRAALDHAVFEGNLRGMQFQESEGVDARWILLRGNQSGMRFRDSKVSLANVVASGNASGINFLRSEVVTADLFISGNLVESLVARESDVLMRRALFTANRRGPRFKGAGEKTDLAAIASVGNLGEGLSLNRVKAEVALANLSGNGLTGLSVTDAEVDIRLSRLAGNGRYEVDNNGATDVAARFNDWGDPGSPSSDRIFDGEDQEGLGNILTGDEMRQAILFPGMALPYGTVSGALYVVGDVIVPASRDVAVAPGARVLFDDLPSDSLFDLCSDHPAFPSSELLLLGRVTAVGTTESPIRFMRGHTGPGEPGLWGGVNLVGGKGGSFAFCDFSGAATGLHAREANDVAVRDSVFSGNEVGMRFSKSRVIIRGNTFRDNSAALRFHEDGGTVSGNRFEGNGTAIFVTEDAWDVAITDNVFSESADYHVKMGHTATRDIEVRGGEFNLPEGRRPDDLIFDKKDDPDLGRVLIVP